MIFSAENEKGENMHALVLAGRKTVTRRSKPRRVGSTFTCQPGRGKKGTGRFEVVHCVLHKVWRDNEYLVWAAPGKRSNTWTDQLNKEAKLEGFTHFSTLEAYFAKKGKNIDEQYRIEFKQVFE